MRQRHETDGQELAGRNLPTARLLYQCQELGAKDAADGDHHATAGLKLLHEGRRDVACSGGHENPVEGAALRPSEITIADLGLDVVIAEVLETPVGGLPEFGDNLDGADSLHQRREHRGLVARPCANLEHC